MCPPEDGAQMLDYMPSHREAKAGAPQLTEEELERQSDWNIRVAEAVLQQRAAK